MFEYQKTRRYFAQTPGGFEEIAAAELKSLGGRNIRPGFRGLYFSADRAALYRVVYQARLLMRVLAPLRAFRCRDRDDLYRAGKAIPWRSLFSEKQSFAVFANASGNPNLTHSKFAALCLKDAAVDYFRGKTGKRPDADPVRPDVWLNLHIEREKGVISLDVSGGAMHRRGYRVKSVEAPMQESLAAAVVNLTGWRGERPLYDPMCGSGTLLCEALMVYCRIPAGYLRDGFGFFLLPDFDAALWQKVKDKADAEIQELPLGLIGGGDADPGALDAAMANCMRLPEGDMIRISRKDFRDVPGLEGRVILCNPPYGVRLKEEADLGAFYKDLGDFLKQRCKGAQAFIYFGNREMIKRIGLKPAWKKPLQNAGLDGRLVRYDLY